MAYQFTRSHSRSSSTGLGSSISCLDGVPFKVGPKFKPPPRVFLPPELSDTSRVSQILNDEYLFDTEEGVLRWAEAREAAVAEQQRLEAERVAKSIQDLSQQKDSDNSDSSGGEENGFAGPFRSDTILPRQAPAQPQRPAFANMSSDILTPVTIVPAKVAEPAVEPTPTANIDLALFEQEDDPFDNCERQLINEMEELKSVLEPLKHTLDSSGNNSTNTCDVNNVCGSGGAPDFNGPVPNHSTVVEGSLTQQSASENRTVTHIPGPMFVTRNEHYEEGDYVELRVNYSSNSVAFNNADRTAGVPNASHSPRFSAAASNIYKQVLPPINAPNAPEGLAKTNLPDTSTATMGVLASADNSGLVNGVVSRHRRHQEGSLADCVESNDGLRNAQSNPNLSDTEPHTVYPLSHSPPSRPSSGQLWNPFKPLPPTTDIMSKSLPMPSSESSSPDLVSPSEFDPYASLSSEGQQFVRNLVSMGFCRPQVARAVHNQGTDEKEVIEYLYHVSKLSDKGFNPIHAETALNLFDNNDTKAERYLEMFLQFQELGFRADRIKEALVRENMDRDKALDYLTA